MSVHPAAIIHPTAVIDDDVTLGAGTIVRQFASLTRGARLGEDCRVGPGVCFDGSVAGNRCVLLHNLAAGPGFLLGDDVLIGPNCTLCNDAWPLSTKDGFDLSQFDGTRWAIVVEDSASIGAGSTILAGVRIGSGAMIAAGSVVFRDVPSRHLWKEGASTPITRVPRRMRLARSNAMGISA
jgi:acetyltransferase-like isoleucine patch superfamily enzyme